MLEYYVSVGTERQFFEWLVAFDGKAGGKYGAIFQERGAITKIVRSIMAREEGRSYLKRLLQSSIIEVKGDPNIRYARQQHPSKLIRSVLALRKLTLKPTSRHSFPVLEKLLMGFPNQ